METNPKHFYHFGPFLLDPAERALTRSGTHVPLTPKAFETLLVRVRCSGHTVEKDELFAVPYELGNPLPQAEIGGSSTPSIYAVNRICDYIAEQRLPRGSRN